MPCNGFGHSSLCNCGWGGEHHGSGPSAPIPSAGTKAIWGDGDFCRPTNCLKCNASVYFVRHNGGSVWFDELGQPWPKHLCMAAESDASWLSTPFERDAPANRTVLGIIIEATVDEPGVSARFRIRCSDGIVVEEVFNYSLNPIAAVGGLIRLELDASNKVGARQFKALYDRQRHEDERRERAKRNEKRKESPRSGRSAQTRPPKPTCEATLDHKCERIKLSFALDAELVAQNFGEKGPDAMAGIEECDPGWIAQITHEVRFTVVSPRTTQRTFSVTVAPCDLPVIFGAGGWNHEPLTQMIDRLWALRIS